MQKIQVFYYSDFLNLNSQSRGKITKSFGRLNAEESIKGAVGIGGGGPDNIYQIGIYVLLSYPFMRFMDGFLNAAGEDLWNGFKGLYRLATKPQNRKSKKSIKKNSTQFFINFNFQDNHIHLDLPIEEKFNYEDALDELRDYIKDNLEFIDSKNVVKLNYSRGKWKAS